MGESIEVSIDTSYCFKLGIIKITDVGVLVAVHIDEILVLVRMENKVKIHKLIDSDVLVDLYI